ncbi:MAG: contractile injection system tape measure protein [Fluviicola sp.]
MSALTKRRVEQALGKAMRRHNLPKGKIRFKNLKIDLGNISSEEFEFGFYKRLESACEELANQIVQEYQYQQWSEKNRNTRFQSERNEKRKQTDELNRIIKLLEDQQQLPNQDQLIQLYFQRYMDQLSTSSKNILDQLIPLPDPHKMRIEASPSSNVFESLDYLLDMLQEGELTASNFSNMLRKYQERFGEPMPHHIQRTLLSTLEETHPEATDLQFPLEKKEHTEALGQIDIERNELESWSIRPQDKAIRFVLQWIDTYEVSGNWLSRLQRAYIRSFERELSGQLLNHLATFNNQMEISAKNENQALKTFLCEKYSATENLRKSGREMESISDEMSDSSKLLEANQQAENQKHASDENAFKSNIGDPSNARYSKREIDFVLLWMEKNKVSGNWLNRLKRAFKKQFDFELGGYLLEALAKYNELQKENVTTDPEAIHTFFSERFDLKRAYRKTADTENVSTAMEIEATNSENEDKQTSVVEMLSFAVRWILFNELKGGWQETISREIKSTFEMNVPGFIKRVIRSKDYGEIVDLDNARREIVQQLFEVATKQFDFEAIEGKKAEKGVKDDADQLAQQFTFAALWASQNSLSGNWKASLKKSLEVERKQPMNSKLEGAINRFEKAVQNQASPIQKPEAFIEFLTEHLFSNGVSTIKHDKSHSKKETSGVVSRQLEFVLDWLTKNQLTQNWIEMLVAAVQTELAMPMHSRLKSFLHQYDKSHGQSEKRYAEVGPLMKELTSQLFEEKGWEKSTEETPPKQLFGEQIAVSIYWLSTHRHLQNWFNELRVVIYQKTGFFMHVGLEQLLKEFNQAHRDKEVSEKDQQELIKLLTENLMRANTFKIAESAQKEVDRSEEQEVLFSKQAAFVLNWILKNEGIKNWQSNLQKEILKVFSEVHPEILQTIEDVQQDLKPTKDARLNSPEVVKYVTNRWVMDSSSYDHATVSNNEEYQSEPVNLDQEPAKTEKEQVLFVLHWLVENDLENGWLQALLGALVSEFSRIDWALKQLLENYDKERSAHEDNPTETHELIDQLTESLLPEREETELADISEQWAFALLWVSEEILNKKWTQSLTATLEKRIQKPIHPELKAQLASLSKQFSYVKWSENQRDELIKEMTANAFVLNEEQQPKIEAQGDHQWQRASETTVLIGQIAALLRWMGQAEWEEMSLESYQSFLTKRIAEPLHPDIKIALLSYEKKPKPTRQDQPQLDMIASVLREILPHRIKNETPQTREEVQETRKQSLSHKIAFVSNWLLENEADQNWVSKVYNELRSQTGKNYTEEIRHILQHLDNNDNKVEKLDRRLIVDYLLENLNSTKLVWEPSDTPEFSQEVLPQLPQLNEVTLLSKQTAFILDWLAQNSLSDGWIDALHIDFWAYTGESFPSTIQTFFNTLSSGELPFGLDESENSFRDYIASELIRRTEDQATETKGANHGKSQKQSFTQTIDARQVQQNIQSFLKPTSREYSEWYNWVNEHSEPLLPQNWLDVIVSRHEKLQGRALSMNKQLMFLEILVGDQRSKIEVQADLETQFRAKVTSYVSRVNKRKKKDVTLNAQALLDAFFEINFGKQWFRRAKKAFEKRYDKKMPFTLQKVLFQFRKESLLFVLDQPLESTQDVRQELLKHFDSVDFEDLQKVIQKVKVPSSDSWLAQVIKVYKKKEKKDLPLSLFIELSKFQKRHPQWKTTDFSRIQKELVERTIQAKFETRRNAESKHSKQSLLQFLSFELPKMKDVENWKTDITKRYQEQSGRAMPRVFRQLLDDLDSKNIKASAAEKSTQRSISQIREAFESFLEKKSNKANADQLIPLFKQLQDSEVTTWFASMMKAYKNVYKTDIPVKLQLVLLEFSSQLGTVSETVETEKTANRVEKIIEIVHAQLESLASKSAEQDQQYLVQLKEWVNENLKHDWSHTQWKQAYEGAFGHALPLWLKEELSDRVQPEAIPDFSKKHPPEQIPKLGPLPQNLKQHRDKPVSEKAKIIRLKKQLEGLRDGKDANVEIIHDAGIMVGWLFWKKCFDRFGWLEKGKFFKKEGIFTGVLAANWLTRLGTSAYPEMLHPFMIRVCDLLEEEAEYVSDESLETCMNGHPLETSIENYYADMMLMWTILKIEEPRELKELFVQREAIVTETFFGWDLEIVPEAYDALLQKHPIPWPMTFIRFPWTNKTFNVKW